MPTVKKPQITVLMPVYNGGSALEKTITSVLRQTFRDFEFIIIDDGSTDGTARLLGHFARKEKRIRILTNRPNQGIVRSLNAGLKAARGRLIARIDCGDICSSDRLKAQREYFRQNPKCVLLGSQIDRMDRSGRVVGRTHLPENDREIRKALFDKKTVITHPSAMYRKFSDLYYRENAYPAEDYDYWLRILDKGECANLAESLVKLVNDPASISHKNVVKQLVITSKIRALLVERLKYGSERSSLPDLRKAHNLRWDWVTWLYGYKIEKNYYKFHPMNFVLNGVMGLLVPSTFTRKTFLNNLGEYIHRKEFILFTEK